MTWRCFAWLGVCGVALTLSGCGDQEPPRNLFPPMDQATDHAQTNPDDDGARLAGELGSENLNVILDSVWQMLRRAAENPGEGNFTIATERLNQYFATTPDDEFRFSPEAREYLTSPVLKLPEATLKDLESREFTIKDARHIEDCMLLHTIAKRVAGDGDDLTRVRRVFDWMVRQVQLVPLGSLAPQGLPQAAARPYDVLLRGMASEEPGGTFSERGWLFLSLCRQLDLDAGLLTYTPIGKTDPVSWASAVVVDGVPYLFDHRIGLAIPGPGGQGVATLEQAINDPAILNQLVLYFPEGASYPTTAAELASGQIGVLMDSTLGYLSPRMRILEKRLSGDKRLVLFRDPAAQQTVFAKALGSRFGEATLWALPIEVEIRLFTDPQFVTATQFPIQRFDSRLPLLAARMSQLHGDLDTAIQRYIALRYAENPLEVDRTTPIDPAVQHDLDMYATYFLGLCQVEKDQPEQAKFWFDQTLKLLPVARPLPPYSMFRWGAFTNLGQIRDAEGDKTRAIRALSENVQTSQNMGNWLRARALIWTDPFAP